MRLVIHNRFPNTRLMVLPPQVNRALNKVARDRTPRTSTLDSAPDHDEAKDGPCGCGYYKSVDSAPDDYLVRVDEWLRGLPDDAARRKFLQKQRVDFERRYTDFRKRAQRNSGNIGPNETAQAYMDTLTGIASRLDRLR